MVAYNFKTGDAIMTDQPEVIPAPQHTSDETPVVVEVAARPALSADDLTCIRLMLL